MLQVSTLMSHGIRSGNLLPELLGEPDENPFGTPDVAEPIHVFILDQFADELRAAFAESGERIVDVLHGEHDAQVAESVPWGAAVIGDHRRRKESGHLESAVTVRRTHHGNLDAHVAQSSDAICPVSFDWGAPLELEAKFGEELNGGVDVFHHDADVVHTLDRHDVSLASNVPVLPRRTKRAALDWRRRSTTGGLGLGTELRHEWNVGRADIQVHLRKECGDPTSVVRFRIENVCDKHPPWNQPHLAINFPCVG